MEIASVLVFVLVFGATMAYVGWPLVHPLLAEDEPSARERRRVALLEEKDRLLAAIRDLDHDRRTGKLDDADHAALTEKLKLQAAEVLKQLDVNDGRRVERPGDASTPPPVPASPVPGERRKSRPDTPTIRVTHAELKAQAAQAEAAAAGISRFCTRCGRPAQSAEDKFCGKCGAALPTD